MKPGKTAFSKFFLRFGTSPLARACEIPAEKSFLQLSLYDLPCGMEQNQNPVGPSRPRNDSEAATLRGSIFPVCRASSGEPWTERPPHGHREHWDHSRKKMPHRVRQVAFGPRERSEEAPVDVHVN